MGKNLTINAINEVYIAQWLKANEGKLKSYGGAFDVKEYLRGAMILIMENFTLRKALINEKDKASLYNALKIGASVGLSLNPLKQHACLIPYEKKDGSIQIDYQVMKAGLVQLALDSGKVEFITSFPVHENDSIDFSQSMGGDEYIFKPAKKDRGKIIGFLAGLKTVDGIGHIKYMEISEINDIRDKYSKMWKKNKENSPWNNSYPGMGCKTVLKALFRSVFLSAGMKKVVDTDDYFEFGPIRDVTPGTTPEDVKAVLEKPEKKTKKEEKKKEETKPKEKDLF